MFELVVNMFDPAILHKEAASFGLGSVAQRAKSLWDVVDLLYEEGYKADIPPTKSKGMLLAMDCLVMKLRFQGIERPKGEEMNNQNTIREDLIDETTSLIVIDGEYAYQEARLLARNIVDRVLIVLERNEWDKLSGAYTGLKVKDE